MNEINDSTPDAFNEDIENLAGKLAEIFDTKKYRVYYNDETEQLFIEIDGLDAYTEDDIEELVEPVLDAYDLDIEEILLLNLKN